MVFHLNEWNCHCKILFKFTDMYGLNLGPVSGLPDPDVGRKGSRTLELGKRRKKRPRDRRHGGLRPGLHSAFHGLLQTSPRQQKSSHLQRRSPVRRNVGNLAVVRRHRTCDKISDSQTWKRAIPLGSFRCFLRRLSRTLDLLFGQIRREGQSSSNFLGSLFVRSSGDDDCDDCFHCSPWWCVIVLFSSFINCFSVE